MVRASSALLAVTIGVSAPLAAGDIPEAVVALDVMAPPVTGRVPEAAPARFVLMPDGTVYVGGTGDLLAARLPKRDIKDIERLISRVRKLPGLGSAVKLGPGETRYRLALRKGPTIVATGDPARAAAALRPLTLLLETLAGFDHPDLRPFHPTQYAISARVGSLPGGCRAWAFRFPPQDVVQHPRVVGADAVADWPRGAVAASVCAGDKTFILAARPLIPGERP